MSGHNWKKPFFLGLQFKYRNLEQMCVGMKVARTTHPFAGMKRAFVYTARVIGHPCLGSTGPTAKCFLFASNYGTGYRELMLQRLPEIPSHKVPLENAHTLNFLIVI